MQMLMLQTFLMLLAAFLLGALLACLTKRTFSRGGRVGDDAIEPIRINADPMPEATSISREETQRFGRALTGGAARSVPVVEVQPVTAEEIRVPRPSRFPVDVVAGPPQPERSYFAIAVDSHDGSMLPPAGVHEARLDRPRMPGPAPEPLPVPRVAVPRWPRPADAPDGPEYNYIATALKTGSGYREAAPGPAAKDIALTAYDERAPFDRIEDGQSYTGIALGQRGTAKPVAPAAARPEAKSAEVVSAPASATSPVAVAAGIAAQRAGEQGHRFVATGGGDDLTRIEGIDEVLASRLNYAGVTRFAQIAGWTEDDVYRMSQSLGYFGRVQYEGWIEQARALAGAAGAARLRETGSASVADSATAAASAAAAAMAASSAARRAAVSTPVASPAPAAPPAAPGSQALTSAQAAAAAMAASTAGRRQAAASPVPDRAASSAPAAAATTPGSQAINSAQAAAAAMAASTAARRPGEPGPTGEAGSAGARPDLTGLRSVKSEALLGDGASEFVRGDLDDLKRIRGIGVLIEKKLNSLGITSYEQVANWSGADIDRISDILDFKGRIERENWIEQARILASGGQTEFSRRVDKGEA